MDSWLAQALVVGAGGSIGAIARLWIASWFADRWGTAFPYGTFFINISGSFVIGLLLTIIAARAQVNPAYRLFFVTGFLGAYTTFSTYSFEGMSLLESGQVSSGLLYLAGSVGAGLIAVTLGAALGRLFV
jgi:CrcB protein